MPYLITTLIYSFDYSFYKSIYIFFISFFSNTFSAISGGGAGLLQLPALIFSVKSPERKVIDSPIMWNDEYTNIVNFRSNKITPYTQKIL